MAPDLAQLQQLVQRCDAILVEAPSILTTYFNPKARSFHANSKVRGRTSITSTCFSVFPLMQDENLLDQFTRRLTPEISRSAFLTSIAMSLIENAWITEELEQNNLYTAPIALYTLGKLASVEPKVADLLNARKSELQDKIDGLLSNFKPPAARFKDYEPSGFINYWLMAALSNPEVLHILSDLQKQEANKCTSCVSSWAISELSRQTALFAAGDDAYFDPSQLAYLLGFEGFGCWGSVQHLKQLIPYALDVVRRSQQKDGLWPQLHPIFHYRERGSVYSFSCEMFEALFRNADATKIPFDWLSSFSLLTDWVERNKLERGDHKGWRSNLLTSDGNPEAWSTAAALLAIIQIRRITRHWLNLAVFERFSGQSPTPLGKGPDPFSEQHFADSTLENTDGQTLVQTLKKYFIQPRLPGGKKEDARFSAVLFGPPGTAKTTVARSIAEALDWPYLYLGTSDFSRHGFERITGTAREVFTLLGFLDRVVVLFDEVEEFVLDRSREGVTASSRMITTSMLSLLQELRGKENVIFFVTTNHLEQFDPAIVRAGGRFDALLCVGPPSTDAKEKIFLREVGLSRNEDREPSKVKKWVTEILAELSPDYEFFAFTEWRNFCREVAPSVALAIDDDSDKSKVLKAIKKVFKFHSEQIANKGEVRSQYEAARSRTSIR